MIKTVQLLTVLLKMSMFLNIWFQTQGTSSSSASTSGEMTADYNELKQQELGRDLGHIRNQLPQGEICSFVLWQVAYSTSHVYFKDFI